MSVKLEKLEKKNVVKLTIEVDAQTFDKGMQEAYKKNKSRFSIPGFRKGKATRKMVEHYYGEGVLYEDAINAVCPEEYDAAVNEINIEPVDRPEIDIEQIGSGENLIFTATVTVKPDFELGEYKGIEVKKIEYNVTEEDINEKIKEMQQKNSRLVTVEDRPVQQGDIIEFAFEGFVDGEPFEGGKAENYQLEIGSGQFIPGFEDQLVGKNIAEEAEVNVSFPEDYNAENLAGKPALFKVKVNQIQFKELPEIDDEFAKDVSEFDTIEELKADVRSKLEEEAKTKEKNETQSAVLDKIAEGLEIDIPEVMIESQISNMMQDFDMRLKSQGMDLEKYMQMTGMQIENFKEQFKDQAQKQVKTTLILEKITKLENIEVTDQDVEAHIEEMSKNYNMDADKIKQMLGQQVEGIKDDLAMQKTVDMLVENAKIA